MSRFRSWRNNFARSAPLPPSKHVLRDAETAIDHALQDESEAIVHAWRREFAEYTMTTAELATIEPGDPRAEALLRAVQAFISRATTHLATTRCSCAIPRWSHAATVSLYESAVRLVGSEAAIPYEPKWQPL